MLHCDKNTRAFCSPKINSDTCVCMCVCVCVCVWERAAGLCCSAEPHDDEPETIHKSVCRGKWNICGHHCPVSGADSSNSISETNLQVKHCQHLVLSWPCVWCSNAAAGPCWSDRAPGVRHRPENWFEAKTNGFLVYVCGGKCAEKEVAHVVLTKYGRVKTLQPESKDSRSSKILRERESFP